MFRASLFGLFAVAALGLSAGSAKAQMFAPSSAYVPYTYPAPVVTSSSYYYTPTAPVVVTPASGTYSSYYPSTEWNGYTYPVYNTYTYPAYSYSYTPAYYGYRTYGWRGWRR